ncbi:hypothetical protein ACP4OV_030423 [Aristida adscensionis]
MDVATQNSVFLEFAAPTAELTILSNIIFESRINSFTTSSTVKKRAEIFPEIHRFKKRLKQPDES